MHWKKRVRCCRIVFCYYAVDVVVVFRDAVGPALEIRRNELFGDADGDSDAGDLRAFGEGDESEKQQRHLEKCPPPIMSLDNFHQSFYR